MLRQFIVAVVAVALPLALLVPALAQDAASPDVAAPIEFPVVTQDQVLAACTAADATEAGCKAVMADYFAYLQQINVAGPDLEALIAALVVALAQADVAPHIKAIVVAAVEDIGTKYATGEQAAAIMQIAYTMAAGGTIKTGALGVSGA